MLKCVFIITISVVIKCVDKMNFIFRHSLIFRDSQTETLYNIRIEG